MIISGVLKLLSAFGTAIVSALAPSRGLWLLSMGSWVCIILAICMAFVSRHWGLSGAIYAVSVGWLGRFMGRVTPGFKDIPRHSSWHLYHDRLRRDLVSHDLH
jgi:hypothetical protein